MSANNINKANVSCKKYFFCGIGGSGMMPLALILSGLGHCVSGSDRSRDQAAVTPDKFKTLEANGINLFPQDGSGVAGQDYLIVSGAIEGTVADVAAAQKDGIDIQTRAELLASIFNGYDNAISVAGTSGKSTVTGMIATIFDHVGFDPTVMNGGFITNFTSNEACPASNVRLGQGDYFITETDESDGSIALYNPAYAVVNNIALDHMPLEDLKKIFAEFMTRTGKGIVLNADDMYLKQVLGDLKTVTAPILTYSLENNGDLNADDISLYHDRSEFNVDGHPVCIHVPGKHNIKNALAALGIAIQCGIDMAKACQGLSKFKGIQRRMQVVGENNGVTVIDDFGHNPDKIAATLSALKEFDGRLIIMFQPHGFAPLRLMGKEIVESFRAHLDGDDMLIMPEVYYAGGTVDRSVTAQDIISLAKDVGINAHWFANRDDTAPFIINNARAKDRIVVMGARDDSLTDFAQRILGLIEA